MISSSRRFSQGQNIPTDKVLQYPQGIYLTVSRQHSRVVIDHDRRRRRLMSLIGDKPMKDFADKVSRAPAQVSHWVSGEKNIGEKTVHHLSSIFALPPGWFDQEVPTREELHGVLDIRDEWAPSAKKNNRDIQIPLLDSRASMGNGTPLTDHVNVVEMVTANLPELRARVSFSAPHNLRLLTGYGDSMSPTFNDGDVLLIDMGVTDLTLDAVYVMERHDQLYVKRIQRRTTGALRMISDNPVYPPEDIDPNRDGFDVRARVLCVWNFRKL